MPRIAILLLSLLAAPVVAAAQPLAGDRAWDHALLDAPIVVSFRVEGLAHMHPRVAQLLEGDMRHLDQFFEQLLGLSPDDIQAWQRTGLDLVDVATMSFSAIRAKDAKAVFVRAMKEKRRRGDKFNFESIRGALWHSRLVLPLGDVEAALRTVRQTVVQRSSGLTAHYGEDAPRLALTSRMEPKDVRFLSKTMAGQGVVASGQWDDALVVIRVDRAAKLLFLELLKSAGPRLPAWRGVGREISQRLLRARAGRGEIRVIDPGSTAEVHFRSAALLEVGQALNYQNYIGSLHYLDEYGEIRKDMERSARGCKELRRYSSKTVIASTGFSVRVTPDTWRFRAVSRQRPGAGFFERLAPTPTSLAVPPLDAAAGIWAYANPLRAAAKHWSGKSKQEVLSLERSLDSCGFGSYFAMVFFGWPELLAFAGKELEKDEPQLSPLLLAATAGVAMTRSPDDFEDAFLAAVAAPTDAIKGGERWLTFQQKERKSWSKGGRDWAIWPSPGDEFLFSQAGETEGVLGGAQPRGMLSWFLKKGRAVEPKAGRIGEWFLGPQVFAAVQGGPELFRNLDRIRGTVDRKNDEIEFGATVEFH